MGILQRLGQRSFKGFVVEKFLKGKWNILEKYREVLFFESVNETNVFFYVHMYTFTYQINKI